MSEYTDEELAAKAKIVLQARKDNDPRYVELIVVMTALTGLSEREVMSKIETLAGGDQ